MDIKGTVRRNQDGHFIHANVDLDIIITEEVQYTVGVLNCDVLYINPGVLQGLCLTK